MFLKQEALREAKGFCDLIDYFGLVDSGIVLTTSGLYVAGWEFSGPDMDAIPGEDAWRIAKTIEKKLRLGSGWTVQCDLIRSEYAEYCSQVSWPDPVSHLIDEERRGRFSLLDNEASPRLSRYFLAISYEPGARGMKRAARWTFSKGKEIDGPGEKALARFRRQLEILQGVLATEMTGVRRLTTRPMLVGGAQDLECDEFLRYLRFCITGEDYPFAVPPIPVHLNQYLATNDFTGGEEPELGSSTDPLLPGKRIAVLAIDGFPEESYAGIMRELDALPYSFRYSQRGKLLDEKDAGDKHRVNMGNWRGRQTSTKSKIMRVPEVPDQFAAEMTDDARLAASNAEHGREVFVEFSAKVIVMDSDPAKLAQAVQDIARVIKYRCGFSCRLETINVVAAWLSSFPGHHYKDLRVHLINTENFAHLMPLSAPYRGLRFNPSKYMPTETPPLFYGLTSGGTPYRFHTHVGDVGHLLLLGPTGGGKTTFLQTGIAQFFRFPNARVIAFDKKRTLYTLCSAMGGTFYDMSTTQMCPLQDLETEQDLDLAAQEVELLLEQNNFRVASAERNLIRDALLRLQAQPGSARSLSDFHMAVKSVAIKAALQIYLGGILDGQSDQISLSRFCVFEMDELYRMDKKTMNGALFYIFGKIRSRLNSNVPTLVTVDEFREALEHPMAARAFEEFLLEGRKLNMAVWLVLQELSKALNSPMKTTVVENTFTKVCLPNPHAIGESFPAYEAIGLSRSDCEIIASAQPKSDYYVASEDGRRLISLELGPATLSFFSSSESDRALADHLKASKGSAWPGEWLRLRGVSEWADYFDALILAAQRMVYE